MVGRRVSRVRTCSRTGISGHIRPQIPVRGRPGGRNAPLSPNSVQRGNTLVRSPQAHARTCTTPDNPRALPGRAPMRVPPTPTLGSIRLKVGVRAYVHRGLASQAAGQGKSGFPPHPVGGNRSLVPAARLSEQLGSERTDVPPARVLFHACPIWSMGCTRLSSGWQILPRSAAVVRSAYAGGIVGRWPIRSFTCMFTRSTRCWTGPAGWTG